MKATNNDIFNSQVLEFSAVSGFNYYRMPESHRPDLYSTALHAPSGAMVYLQKVDSASSGFSQSDIDWYKWFVLNPMSSKYYEWPVDLMQCQTSDGRFVLYYVFPQRAFSGYAPIKNLMYQRKDSPVLDWHSQKICKVCRSLLTAASFLDRSGYALNSFDINNILCHEQTGEVCFRFTHLIRRQDSDSSLDNIRPEEVAIEFASPYLYSDRYFKRIPVGQDYYSIAAMLFRLMIGRLPYEGRGLSNYGDVFDPLRDVQEINHNNYFLHYHQFPHFIFDEEDDSNRLAPMHDNDLPRQRWEALPGELKTMFTNSLNQQTAKTLRRSCLYTPEQWLQACNQYCWNTPEFER